MLFRSTLDGGSILFVDSMESTRAVRVGSRVGLRMPAHCTAAGKVILAQLPAVELQEYLDALPEPLTPNSLSDPEAIRAELERVAAQGFATNFEESEDGLSAVAVAIPEPSGAVRWSITVSLPASRLAREQAPGIAEAAARTAQAVAANVLYATAPVAP